jgi:hypothetical protein
MTGVCLGEGGQAGHRGRADRYHVPLAVLGDDLSTSPSYAKVID